MKNLSSVEFSADGRFIITNSSNALALRASAESRWRVEVLESIPGKSAFRLMLAVFNDRSAARQKASQYQRSGYSVEVAAVGTAPYTQIAGLNNNREYRIYIKRWFETWDEAREYQKAVWPDSDTHIIRAKISEARGRICLTHCSTGETYESTQPIIIKGTDVILYDVPVGSGFHWEHHENRTYPEKIEFTLDLEGRLAVVNEVPLETYLKGVVPSEMSEGFPVEALKAQAVAARCKALANWGIVHASDPFDVCADVHCQVYSGLSKRCRKTDYAVDKTAGLFMMKGDQICDAVFGAVCGGHTEDVENAWGGEALDYLRGRVDGSPWLKRYGSLQEENNLKKWIDDSPDAFCNTQRDIVPDGLQYTVKYYRWELSLSQIELQQALEKRTGLNFGEIIHLIPLLRGVSGRIIRLKVIGTRGETIIDGELNIRKALSETTLWSSCFYVEKSGWGQTPDAFILRGAGFGHGVGMCQTGAAIMALTGRKFHHILKHYYKGVRITKLY
ncbi:SpoIID/LytB domain-containing protein [bacterium]|nr:SpoIID/LytB domain-containing protein [bacterium]